MTTANTSTTSNLVGTLPPEGSPSQLELLDSLLSAGLLSSAKLNVVEFSVNLGIAFLLCYAVSVFYSRFALALSDKKTFAKTFVIERLFAASFFEQGICVIPGFFCDARARKHTS